MKKRNEAKLAIGTLTSILGNKIFDVASNMFLASVGGSSSFFTALYQSSETLISVIVNLFAGALADKTADKRKILIFTDVMCGIVCLILAFFYASELFVWGIIATNILLALFSTLKSPTSRSIVKFALEKERIGIYNGYMKSLSELIKVTSPFITLAILEFWDIRFAILFNALTFFVSAFFESRLQIPTDENNKNTNKTSIFSNIAEGFRYILKNRGIFFIISLAALVNFFLAGYELFLPYSFHLLENNAVNPYPTFIAIGSAGGVIGAFLSMRNKTYSIKRMIGYIFLCGVAIVGIYVALGLYRSFILAGIAVFSFNLSLVFFNIVFMTYIQQNVDSDYIGRVFSVIFTIAIMFMPIGSFIFTGVFSVHSANIYLFVGLGLMIICTLSYFLYKKM